MNLIINFENQLTIPWNWSEIQANKPFYDSTHRLIYGLLVKNNSINVWIIWRFYAKNIHNFVGEYLYCTQLWRDCANATQTPTMGANGSYKAIDFCWYCLIASEKSISLLYFYTHFSDFSLQMNPMIYRFFSLFTTLFHCEWLPKGWEREYKTIKL